PTGLLLDPPPVGEPAAEEQDGEPEHRPPEPRQDPIDGADLGVQEVPEERHADGPQGHGGDVEHQEPAVGHPRQPGAERQERPGDRHVAPDEDRLAAVPVEEVLRLGEPPLVPLQERDLPQQPESVDAAQPERHRLPHDPRQRADHHHHRERERPPARIHPAEREHQVPRDDKPDERGAVREHPDGDDQVAELAPEGRFDPSHELLDEGDHVGPTLPAATNENGRRGYTGLANHSRALTKEARAMSITVRDLRAFKAEGRRFAMLTAYDYPTAQILDESGIPVLLVGDSLAQNVLGYETTPPVTMDEMLHHSRAVARGAKHALIVGDMPFLSYQVSLEEGVTNAGRFLKEGGAHAVKIEGWMPELTEALSSMGIPVMSHLGLTPQSVHAMGGYRVQGRSDEDAHRLLEHATGM